MRTPLLHASFPALWAIALTLPLSATAQETESPKDYKPRTDLFRDPLPAGAVARLGTTRWRYADGVRLIHFIENRKQLLVCSGDGVIHITDLATGRELRRFGTGDNCHLAAITPDGATLAQARWHTDKEHISTEVVHVWDVATGIQVCSINPDFYIWGLHFVAGEGLLGWCYDGVIKVWDKYLNDLQISRDGKSLVAVQDRKIVHFELETGVQHDLEASWAKKGEWGEEQLLSVATASRGPSVVGSIRAVYKPDPGACQ
jgi:WD40 repeat protein